MGGTAKKISRVMKEKTNCPGLITHLNILVKNKNKTFRPGLLLFIPVMDLTHNELGTSSNL